MEKLLITGGAGFIGSHLAERLLTNNDKIVIIDNFNEFYNSEIKENNIKELINKRKELRLDEDYLKVYRGDIRDNDLLARVFNENKIVMVIHLAAMTGVRSSIQRPKEYYDVNVYGTINLLEACKDMNVKKFIFASSSSVYGNNQKVPFVETDGVDTPISPYAASKRAGELLCHTYHHLYDVSVACLRFFTVYGPKQRPDLAIHKFTRLILSDEELPLYGNGNSQRDYTYIDDIIDGIIKSINWIDTDQKQFEVFNLGRSRTVSLNMMVRTIEKVIGKKAIIKRLPPQPGDVNRTYADISKSKAVLGYNPEFDFEEGIKNFVKWYKR